MKPTTPRSRSWRSGGARSGRGSLRSARTFAITGRRVVHRCMDRYQQLIEKRGGEGLTEDEANELGRLMAQRKGEEYANADDPPEDVELERVGTVEATEEDVADLERLKEEEKAREEKRAATPPKGTEQPPE